MTVFQQSSLTDTDAGAVSEHTSGDVHSLQFLEQELGGIRDVDLGDLGLVLAGATLERAFAQDPRMV